MRLTGPAPPPDAAYRHHSHPEMARPVKGGYLLRYKKRLFSKAWREEWVTLFDDSTIAWFKEKDRGEPEGFILVKEAPEMTAVGHWTLRIPGRPQLPSNCHLPQLMAFGNKRRSKVHWLLAKDEEEVNDWMTAISNTLPPPAHPRKSSPDKGNATPDSDSVSPPPQLPPAPPHPELLGDSLSRYSASSNHSGTVYPESPYLQPLRPTTVGGSRTTPPRHLLPPALLATTLNTWDHHWAWRHGLGSGIGYYHNHHADTTAAHHFDLHTSLTYSPPDTHPYSSEDYDHDFDLGCGDDYGMDCSGDFAF